MMHRFYIIASCIIMFWSCEDDLLPPEPDQLLSPQLMAAVLTDAYIANSAKNINNRMLRLKRIKLDSVIYKKHQIDSLRFAQNHAYYAARLKLYQPILAQVKVNLELLKIEKDTLLNREKARIAEEQKRLRDSATLSREKLKDSPAVITPRQLQSLKKN